MTRFRLLATLFLCLAPFLLVPGHSSAQVAARPAIQQTSNDCYTTTAVFANNEFGGHYNVYWPSYWPTDGAKPEILLGDYYGWSFRVTNNQSIGFYAGRIAHFSSPTVNPYNFSSGFYADNTWHLMQSHTAAVMFNTYYGNDSGGRQFDFEFCAPTQPTSTPTPTSVIPGCQTYTITVNNESGPTVSLASGSYDVRLTWTNQDLSQNNPEMGPTPVPGRTVLQIQLDGLTLDLPYSSTGTPGTVQSNVWSTTTSARNGTLFVHSDFVPYAGDSVTVDICPPGAFQPTATPTPTPPPTPTLPPVAAGCATLNVTIGGAQQYISLAQANYSMRVSWQFHNPGVTAGNEFMKVTISYDSYTTPGFGATIIQNYPFYATSPWTYTGNRNFLVSGQPAGNKMVGFSASSNYSITNEVIRIEICPPAVYGTPTVTRTPTATRTPSPTAVPIGTATPSPTLTSTPTNTATSTPTNTPTETPTGTPPPTATPNTGLPDSIPGICYVVTPAPFANLGPLPDLGLVVPTLRTLPTLTATITISATAIVVAVQTIQAGIATPAAMVQTVTGDYSWESGQQIAASWTSRMQPALDWLAILNPSNAAYTTEGGPLWALAPVLNDPYIPLLPLVVVGLIVAFVRLYIWIIGWLLKLIDLVIKLIELIPGE